jgi:hypothetical protein
MKIPLLAVLFVSTLAAIGQQAATSLEMVVGDNHLQLNDAIRSMPHTTLTVVNGHTGASETYAGVPLIDLLAKEGVPHGKDLHGNALSEYVVATGADGYKAVLALAEVDPEFHPGTVIVADTLAGKPLDEKTGPYKLVVSEDKRPARSVHSLVKIEVKSAE